MKGKRWRALLLAAALLIALRVLSPDLALAARARLLSALGYADGTYAAALDGLGERVSESFAAEAPEDLPVLVRFRAEEAAVTGEREPESPPADSEAAPLPDDSEEEPAAVAAFLESQLPFRDYALPENVDYVYEPLPFDYAVPVSGRGSSGFGYRLHPLQNVVKFHYGTDIAANTGDDILAFADGTVLMAGFDAGYGNYLILDHGGGWHSLYAHCSYLGVTAGETVTRGQPIARVGATGQVTGPHLHFELTRGGVYRNPEYYING